MPDYKTPPKRKPVNLKKLLSILGLAVIILGLGYLLWSGKIKFPKYSKISSVTPQQQQADQQQKAQERQQVLAQMESSLGYPTDLPEDLLFSLSSQAKTTATKDKAGKIITQTQYSVLQDLNSALLIYPESLKNNGWQVRAAGAGAAKFDVSKDGFNAVLNFEYADFHRTSVTITYSN